MRTPRRLLVLTALAAAATLSLAACTPTAPHHSGGSHSSGGGSSSGSSASPSATPTPTPVAVAPPQVRVPLTCDQIAPVGQISSVLGATMTFDNTDVANGKPWLDSDLETYGWVQDGARVCNYLSGGTNLTFYRAYIMPDVPQSQWTPYLAQINTPSQFNLGSSAYGTNSNLNCESSYHILDCGLEDLIGSTWVSLYGYSDDEPVMTIAAAAARFKPLFNTTVNAVKTATVAEPAWTDPAASAVSLSGDTGALNSALATALGASINTEDYAYGPDVSEATDEALIPVHFDQYTDDVGNYQVTIKVLPQGSWAWDAIAAKASTDAHYSTVAGLGDKAISFSQAGSLTTPYQAAVEVEKGHNVYSVEVETTVASSGAGVLSIATKAATAVATFIG